LYLNEATDHVEKTLTNSATQKDSILRQSFFFGPGGISPNMFQTVSLSGSRGERQLFSDVSVTVKPGTLLAVVGANGSGKTSFLRMLCGLLLPDRGTILWQGKDIHQLKELYAAQLTYIGHLNGIKDELTPVENLKVSAWLAGDDSSGAIVQKALEAVGLERSVHPLPTRVLSQGQKRRVALARLWLSTRPLWLLDEPFASLDAVATSYLTQRLQSHLSNDGMVVVATHQEIALPTDSVQHLRLAR
jgi:heme exporter protein A